MNGRIAIVAGMVALAWYGGGWFAVVHVGLLTACCEKVWRINQ